MIFDWIERLLPDDKQDWARDMRAEFDYIPKGLSRTLFQFGCLRAAIEEFIKHNIGLQRVGQGLIALGLMTLSFGCLAMAAGWDDQNITRPLYGLCGLYSLTAILTWVDLEKMKQFSLSVGIVLTLVWGLFNLPYLALSLPEQDYVRALSIEAAVLMFALYISGVYISWIGETRHA